MKERQISAEELANLLKAEEKIRKTMSSWNKKLSGLYLPQFNQLLKLIERGKQQQTAKKKAVDLAGNSYRSYLAQ